MEIVQWRDVAPSDPWPREVMGSPGIAIIHPRTGRRREDRQTAALAAGRLKIHGALTHEPNLFLLRHRAGKAHVARDSLQRFPIDPLDEKQTRGVIDTWAGSRQRYPQDCVS